MTFFERRLTMKSSDSMVFKKCVSVTVLFAGLACTTVLGCTQKSTVTKEVEIKTPGGTTTIETKQEIKKTGDHKTDGTAPSTNP